MLHFTAVLMLQAADVITHMPPVGKTAWAGPMLVAAKYACCTREAPSP
jgi:hypothetical protein